MMTTQRKSGGKEKLPQRVESLAVVMENMSQDLDPGVLLCRSASVVYYSKHSFNSSNLKIQKEICSISAK